MPDIFSDPIHPTQKDKFDPAKEKGKGKKEMDTMRMLI